MLSWRDKIYVVRMTPRCIFDGIKLGLQIGMMEIKKGFQHPVGTPAKIIAVLFGPIFIIDWLICGLYGSLIRIKSAWTTGNWNL